MLANYEKRNFENNADIWIKKYRNLSNLLHWHIESEIIYIEEGNANVYIDGKLFLASKGQSFYVQSGVVHYIKSDNSIVITIQIKSKLLTKIEPYDLLSPLLYNNYDFPNLYNKIISYSKIDSKFQLDSINCCVMELIYTIFSKEEITLHTDKNQNFNQTMKVILEYISDNLEFVTFEDVVNKFGYSKSYFSKLFKKLSGINFNEYLNICKIQKAILLLQNEDSKITDIASQCGFNSVRHFDRIFKKLTTYAPCNLPRDYILENIIISHHTFNPTLSTSEII